MSSQLKTNVKNMDTPLTVREMKTEAMAEIAVRMNLLDAIEKRPDASPAELIEYMKSKEFQKASEGYMKLLKERAI